MSTVKSYPHYEVNVKDNSIYNFAIEEILPVHRAVWVLPTQKGPVGQPVWVRNKSQFDRIFGKQTLELYTKKYQSPVSFWLRNLLTMNGQFIVRALPENAERAAVVLWARVTNKPNGMVKLLQKEKADGTVYFPTVQEDLTERADAVTADFSSIRSTADYGKYAIEPESVDTTSQVIVYSDSTGEVKYSCLIRNGVKSWHAGSDLSGRELSEEPNVAQLVAEEKFFHMVTPKKEDCIEITFIARPANRRVLEAIDEGTDIDETILENNVTDSYTEYPILVVAANYKGDYGNDYAFRFFSNPRDNNAENVAWFKSVFNSFGAYRREFNTTTTKAIPDSFDRNFVNFAANPDTIDRETAVAKDMESVLENSYDSNAEETEEFPFIIYSFEKNLNEIGKQIIEIENHDMVALGLDSLNYESYDEFVEDYTENDVFKGGYAIDVLGGLNAAGNPYPHVQYANGESFKTDPFIIVGPEDVATKILNGSYAVCPEEQDIINTGYNGDVVKLDKNTDIFLIEGTEGTGMWEIDGTVNRSFLDEAMYNFVTLNTNKTIVDKFRYPFTHIYDIGYSMTTKFAMLDFLDIRDDVGVELSTQVLLSSEWATGFKRSVKLNDMYEDVMNGVVLRERAMLMRESILFNTDTMRASIYTQVGRPVDINFVASSGVSTGYAMSDPVPFTFWSAYQHAQYENRPYMSIQEPRGLPYSYNNLFKDWKWVPHYENQKEKTWNCGLNYCQYADMSRIFYPALRTVYRHDTSILSDQWDVDALIYTKHECRKAWAHFVGRNDRVAELQEAIKRYLEEKLAYLYSGKFDFEVTVYQTEEEQKIGYIQHVKLKLTFPATLRVLIFDIEVNREGYTPEA